MLLDHFPELWRKRAAPSEDTHKTLRRSALRKKPGLSQQPGFAGNSRVSEPSGRWGLPPPPTSSLPPLKTRSHLQNTGVGSNQNIPFLYFLLLFIYLFFAFSRATPTAYEGSQARGRIRAVPTPQPQQRRILTASSTCTAAQGNAGSLTHRARPEIEPASLWILVGFINC